MKKQLIITLVAVLLIVVGLSGCIDTDLTNIGDLQANPEKYLDKEVKVKGFIIGYLIQDEEGHAFEIRTDRPISGNYYLTGVVETGGFIGTYYLNVTKAEAV